MVREDNWQIPAPSPKEKIELKLKKTPLLKYFGNPCNVYNTWESLRIATDSIGVVFYSCILTPVCPVFRPQVDYW